MTGSPPPPDEQLAVWMDELIEKIEGHTSYGPAVREAVQLKQRLILNYHTHAPGQPFCVSIQVRPRPTLQVLGQGPRTKELAHVRGIGQTEAEGEPLMRALGQRLKIHFALEADPEILIAGKPA